MSRHHMPVGSFENKAGEEPQSFCGLWMAKGNESRKAWLVSTAEDEMATQQVSLKRNINLRIPGDNFTTGTTKKQVVP